jgi:zinc and cadmium transporter
MSGGRWTRKSITLVNLAFASMCPLGALVFCFGLGGLASSQPIILSCALGFAGGIFLCISLADILPELQFHHHDRGLLSVALLFGVLLAYLIGFVESGHGHSHDHDGLKTSIQSSEPEHSHSEHDHAH